MAFTRKLASGKYQGRYRSPDGKLRSAGTFARKTDAKASAVAAEYSARKGTWIDPSLKQIPLDVLAREILDARPLHTRPNTYQRDAAHYNHIRERFGSCSVGSIEHADIQRWITVLSVHYKPHTVINCFALFRIIMKEATRRRYITINPCDGIKLPRVEHMERRFLNVDEVETLANAMSDRYRPMVHIGCYLGLRWGEIAGLQLRHVNILKRQLTVAGSLERVGHLSRFAEPKSKAARRLLPLPSFLAESLEDHLASLGGDYLFTSREGGLLNYQNWLRRAWHPAVRAAGLWPFTPHEMRHTAAALMIDQGANMLSLQRRMGHTDIHTTLALYGHLFPETDDLLTQRLDDLRGAYVAQRASNVPQIVDIPG